MKKLYSRRSHKKGSLEISVQAIVIVVLAMTLLGLGLGFVRGLFGQTTELTSQVTDQIKNQILDDLRRGDKPLSFPTDQVELQQGDEKILAIGVKNQEQTELKFKIEIKEINPTTGAEEAQVDSDFGEFLYPRGVQTLSVTESNVYPIVFTAQDLKETRIYDVRIMYDSPPATGSAQYASKTFFIKVN